MAPLPQGGDGPARFLQRRAQRSERRDVGRCQDEWRRWGSRGAGAHTCTDVAIQPRKREGVMCGSWCAYGGTCIRAAYGATRWPSPPWTEIRKHTCYLCLQEGKEVYACVCEGRRCRTGATESEAIEPHRKTSSCAQRQELRKGWGAGRRTVCVCVYAWVNSCAVRFVCFHQMPLFVRAAGAPCRLLRCCCLVSGFPLSRLLPVVLSRRATGAAALLWLRRIEGIPA